ncbi:TrbI/VirB10 family protein [Pantoea agglomerans]|uniref:TrbI/VirB10 family protein n=1 Tax=Enterobacter agglomerans TaxID=549 RepID=UPI00320A09DD
MEPTENSISEGAADTKEVGRGDFSLKPAGRRNGNGKLLFFAIGGGVLLVIVLAVLFGWAVISSMDKADPVIDESSVKAAPVLQQDTGKDDSMAAQMDKILNKPAPEAKPAETETASTSAASQKTEESASTQQRQSHATEPAGSEAGSNQSPYAQPQQQEEEQLFAKVNRFESTGMSAGSGGGSAAYGGGDSGGGGDQEARMRQFINADPNELARNLAKSAGGSSSGSDGLSGGGSGGSLLDNLGGGSQYAMARATLAPEQKFLLRRRSIFQCVLDTGIRTNYPGFVECHLLQPLYSSDGSVIIARAGAIFYGEQKVELKAGQTSVFTTWTDMETSTGRPGERPVRAPLNGLGTDPMGRSGTDAEVDNHWGQRIGGAVMLSTFKDVLNGGMNAMSKNSNNQFTFNNTESSTEDLASKILDSTIGIPPTGFVNPGTVINIVVAQDIDFSSVFKTRRIN